MDIPALVERILNSPENHCFACGPGNPIGLHLRFEHLDGKVRATFTPQDVHEGFQNVIHGGILAALVDEAMAYVLFFLGVQAVTARLQVRYREVVRTGERLVVEARVTRDTRKLADLYAQVCRGDRVVVEASGRFVKVGPISALVEGA